MLFIKLFLVLGVVLGSSTSVLAEGERTNQNRRIKVGIKSGELTAEEAADIRSDRKATRALKQKMKADGTYTKEERQKIREMKKGVSQKIYNEKHDAEKSPEPTETDAGNTDPEFDNVD